MWAWAACDARGLAMVIDQSGVWLFELWQRKSQEQYTWEDWGTIWGEKSLQLL